MIRYFITGLLSSLVFLCQGQFDSLNKELNQLIEADYLAQIKVHSALAWEYRDNRPDSALYHANIAFKLAVEHNETHFEIQALNYIGVAYRNLGNFTKAFEKYLEALRKAEDFGDKEQRGYSLINLGNLYLYQTNYDGAIKYFIQALDQAQSLANKRMVAYCFLNLGRSYIGIEEFGQSELYFKQAIDLRSEIGDEEGVIAAQIGLANVYRSQGQINKSLTFYLKLVDRIKDSDNSRALSQSYYNISKLYFILQDIENAELYAKKGLEIARKVSSRIDEKDLLNNLSRLSAYQGSYEEAYNYFSNYAELNQQLFSEENIRQIEQLKNQYEIEKKEQENAFLKQQDELNQLIINRQRVILVLSILGLIMAVVIAVIIYRAFIIRKRLSNEIEIQRDQMEVSKNLIEEQSAKLKQLDTAKSRFFANVSHDLRTPLSLIMGNLEMMHDDEESSISPASMRNLDIAFKNSKRLLHLTDEINDLTRLEEGKMNLSLEVISIGSYIKMLAEMFRSTAEFKGVKFNTKIDLEPYDGIKADPIQFEKVLYNLLSNAIKHTNSGDSITVKSIRKESSIFISVHDTGNGISKEALPHVFDRFYQSKDNIHNTREGLGVGLALVKDLIELHNGKIEVASIQGIETVFTIVLPYFEYSSKDSPSPSKYISDKTQLDYHLQTDASHHSSGAPFLKNRETTILIVDDHPEIRHHIRQVLEDDFNLLEASHGIEALDILNVDNVDLIISDLMMPWMDGFEFIEALGANEEYKKIPVLIVSARITEKDQDRVLYHGINEYLQKPFRKKELKLRINNLLLQRNRWQTQENSLDSMMKANTNGSIEKDLLSKIQALIMEKISDENLSVMIIADAIAASERQVYRLIKKLTGLTPYEYIMDVRMKYADYLIRKKKVKSVSEAGKCIGIKNVTNFSKQFEKRFGCKPKELFQV